MASVPMSLEELEVIVSDVARDLLEKWAVESTLDNDQIPAYALMAAETAAFVIEHYMDYVNALMDRKEREANAKPISFTGDSGKDSLLRDL